MTARFFDTVFTSAVREAQEANGSRSSYARMQGAARPDWLSQKEVDFIAARDSFYLASVTETGWPYVQHRGGPPGFVKSLDERTLAFSDFRGNRQYVSLGNITADDRVALFFMDYPNRVRLKLLGHMRAVDLDADPELGAEIIDPNYKARVERAFVIDVEAFDWNCPQHITPRYTLAELEPLLEDLRARIAELELAPNRSPGDAPR